MTILQPGYSGSVLDPAYIRIDGVDYALKFLSVIEEATSEKLGFVYKGAILMYPMPYDSYTIDEVAYVPLGSYEALLAALNVLNAYFYQGPGMSKLRSTAGTNARLVKVGKTTLFSIISFSPSGAPAYLKIFDTDKTPDPSSDIPVMTFDTRHLPAAPVSFANAPNFRKGLAIAIVGGGDDGDNTAVGAGDVQVTLIYE